ncbi:cytochrome P450 716B1-like [Tripterygium wilfordii]|uniref:cytochrome P450 716B1-like n=1 Tax=Tripterygium wilfordii TaxID=458696 RepID=UPI0018F833C3|nr:cytochrome P450 716B1-like [Tripterygium wilfordii]
MIELLYILACHPVKTICCSFFFPLQMNTLLAILVFFVSVFIFFNRKTRSSKRLPPGSLGLPFLGQSLEFLRAMRSNDGRKWLEQRIRKYGPVSKLNLFGKPAVFIHGQAANKLVFTSDSSGTAQTTAMRAILGDQTLFGLSGHDHKRVRNALMTFLKPESLKAYVGKMDDKVNEHLQVYWQGKREITVLPLMKTLTFNIICSLLFGIEHGIQRDQLLVGFQDMIGGMWSVPINLPFTYYNRSLKASSRVRKIVKGLIRERQTEIKQNHGSPHRDLITSMLNLRNEANDRVITDEEIVQNVMLVMTAGHDTSSVLITFLIRLLATNTAVYTAVCQEQEEIAKSKLRGESLTWEDLAKMKYTWRVALETLRMIPPAFGGFRKALRDIEFDGYIIPKGWQIFWVSSMTQMDEHIFPEPSKFDPGRFENQASIPPYSFIPFGGGPHLCAGYEFAKIETLVTIHYIVTQFTWKLTADDSFTLDPMPTPTRGLPIQIFPRNIM